MTSLSKHDRRYDSEKHTNRHDAPVSGGLLGDDRTEGIRGASLRPVQGQQGAVRPLRLPARRPRRAPLPLLPRLPRPVPGGQGERRVRQEREETEMTHGSLFSGFGAADLAAEWMGWRNAFWCEIDPFPRRVLQYWFPDQIGYEDITKTDFTRWRGKIDVLTGGFPCQPFSVAGQRKGADDDRYLWPQVVRAVHEIRPAWVVGENVAGILTMVQPGEEVEVGSGSALFDENHLYRTEQQYVLETVCQDLEREGYSVQPFVIPACAVGAPHRRDRVWIVARRIAADTSRNGDSGRPGAVREEVGRQDYELRAEPFEHGGLQTMAAPDTDEHRHTPCREGGRIETEREERFALPGEREVWSQRPDRLPGLSRDASHASRAGWEKQHASPEPVGQGHPAGMCREELPADRWAGFPTQPPVCRGNDGLPFDVERLTLPFAKWRAGAVKGYGNAIVPQVMYEIFKAIGYAENEQLT